MTGCIPGGSGDRLDLKRQGPTLPLVHFSGKRRLDNVANQGTNSLFLWYALVGKWRLDRTAN